MHVTIKMSDYAPRIRDLYFKRTGLRRYMLPIMEHSDKNKAIRENVGGFFYLLWLMDLTPVFALLPKSVSKDSSLSTRYWNKRLHLHSAYLKSKIDCIYLDAIAINFRKSPYKSKIILTVQYVSFLPVACILEMLFFLQHDPVATCILKEFKIYWCCALFHLLVQPQKTADSPEMKYSAVVTYA